MWGATPAGAAAGRPRPVVARRGRPLVKRRLRLAPRRSAGQRRDAAARGGAKHQFRRGRIRAPWRAPRAWPRFARTRPELELARRSSPPQAPPRSRVKRRRAHRRRPRRRIGPSRPPYTSHQRPELDPRRSGVQHVTLSRAECAGRARQSQAFSQLLDCCLRNNMLRAGLLRKAQNEACHFVFGLAS